MWELRHIIITPNVPSSGGRHFGLRNGIRESCQEALDEAMADGWEPFDTSVTEDQETVMWFRRQRPAARHVRALQA